MLGNGALILYCSMRTLQGVGWTPCVHSIEGSPASDYTPKAS